MKKHLLFTALFIASGSLMAQNLKIAPLDNTLNGKLTQTFKPDSTWRTLLPSVSTDKLFKQEDIDINKLTMQNQLIISQLNTNSGYNMPVVKLEGKSNMPIKKIGGYYTMPVVREEVKKRNKLAP
jgi:hypothetical protein